MTRCILAFSLIVTLVARAGVDDAPEGAPCWLTSLYALGDTTFSENELSCALELARRAGVQRVARVVKTRGPAKLDVATCRVYEQASLLGDGRVRQRVVHVGLVGSWRAEDTVESVCGTWQLMSSPHTQDLLRTVIDEVTIDLLPGDQDYSPVDAARVATSFTQGGSEEFRHYLRQNGWAHIRRLGDPPAPFFADTTEHRGMGHDLQEVIVEVDYYLLQLTEFICMEPARVVHVGAAYSVHSNLLAESVITETLLQNK